MKRYLLTGLCVVMGTIAAFAQTNPEHPPKRSVKQHDRLKTELSLNDQQYANIKEVNKKYREQRLSLKGDSSLSREQKVLARKKHMAEQQKEINALLTPEQQTKWRALKEKRSEKRHDRKEATKRMKQELSLTDQQTTEMKKAKMEMRHKLDLLRTDSKATKDAQRTEVKKIRDEHNAQIKSILSEDQFQKWKELRKKGRDHNKRKTKGN